MGALNVYSTVDLEKVEAEVKVSQDAVLRLLNNEERALERLEEIAAIADPMERLEEAAKLIIESESLVTLAKEMSTVIGNTKKRMEEVIRGAKQSIHDEVESMGGKVETKGFKLTIKNNPVKVIVDDLAAVPKKYKREPDPIPPVEEWEADKNVIKTALTKERVQSINGVHLEESTRVEVKPR